MNGRLKSPWQVRALNWLFGWVAFAYIAVILLVTPWRYLFRPIASQSFVATHDLAHNHRIAPEDIRLPHSFTGSLGFYVGDRKTLEGKYVVPDIIHKDCAVDRTKVRSTPELAPPLHAKLIAVPLGNQPELVRLLDVQSAVSLFGQGSDSKPIGPIHTTVQAMLCTNDEKGKGSCYAILALQCDTDLAVAIKNKDTLRIVIDP